MGRVRLPEVGVQWTAVRVWPPCRLGPGEALPSSSSPAAGTGLGPAGSQGECSGLVSTPRVAGWPPPGPWPWPPGLARPSPLGSRGPWALGSASLISEADRRRGSRGGVRLTQSQRGQPLSVFPTSHQPLINNPQPLSREQPLWKPGSQEPCQGQQSCCAAGRAPQAAPRRPQGPLGQPSAPGHLSLPRPFPRPRGWC